MPFRALSTLFLSSLLLLTACNAAADKPPAGLSDKIAKAFPNVKVTSIHPAQIKGLYEVVLGKEMIVYTDAAGDYILVGQLIDPVRRQNLTQQRMEEINVVDINKLPLDIAVKEVRGNGSRKLVVFTDPDCPYCKKLEADSISQLNNVTIYNFLMPVASLHPNAALKSRQIWCSPDRLVAWKDYMLHGKALAGKGDCENPVQNTIQLAAQMGINSTPTLIFENGRQLPGALPAAEIEKRLVAAQKK